MKKYTQAEFDALPVIDGKKQCPTGDYSNICSFGGGCSFGERCSFGEWCSFGERCSFGKGCKCEFGEFYHMCACGGFGSCDRTTYFFGLMDGNIGVRCGCFAGTIEQWEAEVRETHGDSGIAKAYLGLIEPVRLMMAERRPSNG